MENSEIKLPAQDKKTWLKFKNPCVTEIQTMEARDFCRLMFGLSAFNESDILEIEQTSQYLCAARLLLCKILGVSWSQVIKWGRYFQGKIPQCHKKTLWLYWQFHQRKEETSPKYLINLN